MNRFIHHVRIAGGETAVSMEPDFWDQFRLIAVERGTSIRALIDEIDRTGRLLAYREPGTPRVLALSAAVRVFVLHDLMRKLAVAEARASRRSSNRSLRSRTAVSAEDAIESSKEIYGPLRR